MHGRETILCVDDDPHVRALFRRLLREAGHTCDCAADTAEARAFLARCEYTVVLCDIDLQGTSGLDLLSEVAHRPGLATVIVSGRDDLDTAANALARGAYGYVTKPFSPSELLISIANAVGRRRLDEARSAQLERAYASVAASEKELRRAYAETVIRLGRAMDFHDGETGAHVERVGYAASSIARRLGLDDLLVARLRLAAPLHDIGKIALGEAILQKPAPLSDAERQAMQRHTIVGHELLDGSGNELLDLAATVALTHHEAWDGSGYPNGLLNDEIPLAGRIVAVADVFDALTSDRPYRSAWTRQQAIAHLTEESGHKFDPMIVDALTCSIDQPGWNADDIQLEPTVFA